MKLRDWMTKNGHDDASFAALVAMHVTDGSNCARKTVEKWRYGTRTPRSKMLPIISKVTSGQVTPNDFVDLSLSAGSSSSRVEKVA